MDGNRCPLLFASKMEDFTNLLRRDYEIQYIYVCEIFTRPQPRHCSLEQYGINRQRALLYLETLLDDDTYTKLWKHRRIFNSPLNLFKRDVIHLNVCGTRKFYSSLKRAIILLSEEFCRI